MSRPPRYPMPPQQRDETEMVLRRITDREARDEVRRLVARTYAAGFDDGDLYGQTVAWNDQRAAHDPASGPEPATGAPGTAGADAGTGEAG